MSDFRCGHKPGNGAVEIVTVKAQGTAWGGRPGPPEYEVPRVCMEALGIDCSPLDRRDERGRQETVWIRSDQSERLRRHRHFQLAEASA